MKRSFTGQMMTTISVIFLTLILASGAAQVLYYRSTMRLLSDQLSASARAAGDMVGLYGADSGTRSAQALRFQLNYAARATENDILVADEDGIVISCSCGMQSCSHLGAQLPAELMQKTQGRETLVSPKAVIPCYEAARMAAIRSVTLPGSGEVRWILCSTDASIATALTREAIRTNLIVVVLVMVLSIPLVWWIVRRQTKPVKQLTAAARRITHGQMDVRVRVDQTDTAELNELAVAFNNMASALAKSELKRQEFIANVSHELKTPMTTISGYMDGMLDGTIPPESQRHYMEIISSEVKRLSRLVRSMLEVSRLQDQGIPEEKKSRFDICQTVGEVLLSFEQKINDKRLDVQTELPDLGARVLAEPDSITQVVYNLIDNAVKFCPDRGLLGLKVTETRAGKYLISIRNTGPTIPPDELPLVFDRFHKTDKSRSVDRDGWGLGLYIVKTIILSHGEDIYVTSRDGVTEFSFTLPKAP